MGFTLDKSKSARATTLTGATSIAVASLTEFKSLGDFLWWLTGAAGAGAAVYALIEFADSMKRKHFGQPLSGTFKQYIAKAYAVVLPVGAYLVLANVLFLTTYDEAQMLATIAVGMSVASSIHFEKAKADKEAAQIKAVEASMTANAIRGLPPP